MLTSSSKYEASNAGNNRSSTSRFSVRNLNDRRETTINVSKGLLLSLMIMILRAHAEAPFPISRIFLDALLLSVYPLYRKLISSTYQGGSWRERITQFRHVTIPRLEKPTNFKTNGTVISTPDMTNSRPFLSCILPLLCIVASLRIPAPSSRLSFTRQNRERDVTNKASLHFIPTSCDYDACINSIKDFILLSITSI